MSEEIARVVLEGYGVTMKKRPGRTEETLARLAAIERDPGTTGIAEVRAALAHERSFVVGRAADVAFKLGLSLEAELDDAFRRVAAPADDRDCTAADTVLKAMARLGIQAPDTYLTALHMHRSVKSAEGFVDVAAPLRAHAAMALVETGFTSALEEVAPMLADPEASVRTAAAEALGVLGGSGAAAVLLFKLGVGDLDSEVLGACLSGLLRVDIDRYLPKVAKYLEDDDVRLVELVALALGETRAVKAFAPLRDAIRKVPRSAMATVFLALALLRCDEATAHLIGTVERGELAFAALAVGALSLHRHDEAMTTRVRNIVETRRERRLREVFAAKFG
ncbi:MAG: HEAT repeat domain-containing protein [Polyangiaceae bacterium]